MPTTKAKVVISRGLGPHALDILKARDELELVIWPEDRPCERSWLLENIRGAAGVVIMITDKADVELFEKAGSSLKVVSTVSVGYEHIDVIGAKERGIRIGYTPDVLTDAVADLTVMLILMAGRNAGESISLVQSGKWPDFTWSPFFLCGPQLSPSQFAPSRTVGFLGFGRIAQATLSRLVAFGITRAIFTSNPKSQSDPMFEVSTAARLHIHELKRVDMDELARESDVLVVLAPGGSNTYHIINEGFLRKMKNTAILVNTSRGSLVDSDALAKALQEKWIWGAGLDVVEGEPKVGLDHPLVKEPRCVIVPHIGSGTTETRIGMTTLAAKNVIGGVLGEDMLSEYGK